MLIYKVRRRISSKIIKVTRGHLIYPMLYKSYWRNRFFRRNSQNSKTPMYFTAVPHLTAGIGHQLANWIAGYWFARKFELHFAHTAFPSEKWEIFLGFGADEKKVVDLIKDGYKRIVLPLFDEYSSKEVELIREIIGSYYGNRVIFVCEQDQFYKDQYGVIDEICSKFHNSQRASLSKLEYSNDLFNIAIHVRRGDIVLGQESNNQNLQIRWQDNSYFEKVLSTVIENIATTKPIAIYLFSQGKECDFDDFKKFDNLNFCLNMSAQDSFLHMAYADLLITSKSSFSYKPALLSRGIKICPENFWHGYPNNENWILADDYGHFDANLLSNLT